MSRSLWCLTSMYLACLVGTFLRAIAKAPALSIPKGTEIGLSISVHSRYSGSDVLRLGRVCHNGFDRARSPRHQISPQIDDETVGGATRVRAFRKRGIRLSAQPYARQLAVIWPGAIRRVPEVEVQRVITYLTACFRTCQCRWVGAVRWRAKWHAMTDRIGSRAIN